MTSNFALALAFVTLTLARPAFAEGDEWYEENEGTSKPAPPRHEPERVAPTSEVVRVHIVDGEPAELDASNRAQLAGGIVMTSVGGLGILFGLTAAAIGMGWNDEGMSTAGGITIGAGAGVLTGGIFLITASRNDIEIDPDSDGSARISPQVSVNHEGATLGAKLTF